MTMRCSVAITVSSNRQVPVAVSPSTVISGWPAACTVMISGPSLARKNATISSRPAQLQRLPEDRRAVVDGGVRGEHVRHLVPQLLVDAAQVAVLHLADLFERGKVHVTSLEHPLDRNKNMF